MSTFSMSMHRVSDMRVNSYYPGNANCISIIVNGEDGSIELSFYGLPREKAGLIVKMLGDDMSVVYDNCGTVPLQKYLETMEVFEAMEA